MVYFLGERVIAEGVETAGHLGRLRELGCDLAQDRHSSEPLPSEAAAALYSKTLENGIRWARETQAKPEGRVPTPHHPPPPSFRGPA